MFHCTCGDFNLRLYEMELILSQNCISLVHLARRPQRECVCVNQACVWMPAKVLVCLVFWSDTHLMIMHKKKL